MVEQLNASVDRILIATRTEAVIDRIRLPGTDYYIDPESYQRCLYPHWGRLRRPDTDEAFLLTERPFHRINRSFRTLPSNLIEFYLDQARSDRVTVLDGGGGRDATAAREIALRYPDAQVMNIDLVAVGERKGNLISLQGDICHLGLPDASITLAYSYQVLPYMNRKNGCARQIRAIEEIARVLEAGGTGIIDYTDSLFVPEDVLISIERNLDGSVISKRKSYGGVFLVITRNPINATVMVICAGVP